MRSFKLINISRVVIVIAAFLLTTYLFISHNEQVGTFLKDFFTTDYLEETGASNAVAAIYLNYRVFDTLFEALMLMVSVIEVINISYANQHEGKLSSVNTKNESEIIGRMVGIVYPFIVLIGFYIILNGHVSPGGGFQGGTILATALITRYLVQPNFSINLERINLIEKFVFFLIVLTPIIYLFEGFQPDHSTLANEIYMIVMNTLIGIKVFCGLSIIFYRFVFYENATFHQNELKI